MKVGFIGLGNVGGKLAGSLLRNGVDLMVRDLDNGLVEAFAQKGAKVADKPSDIAEFADVIITCLPSPAASRAVMTGKDGIIPALEQAGNAEGKVWLEMSTTDEAEVKNLAERLEKTGAMAMDSPVSGGCHRAATGNIAIFAGGKREAFEKVLPLLTFMGRRILHTGPLGSASVLKVVTNYLASVHLVALGEALTTAAAAGMDLATTYEAIRISSGNSFVHETESQVILNGSYNINFTMDLVQKDMGLFQQVAERSGVKLEISPLVIDIFKDGTKRYGPRAWSSMIVKRYEDDNDLPLRAPGFPPEMVDDEPEERGREVVPN